MKLYRDMTAEERAETDKLHQEGMEIRKYVAEFEMSLFDSASPARRQEIRQLLEGTG